MDPPPPTAAAAAYLLLIARRSLETEPLDAPAVAELLHEAVARFAEGYVGRASFEPVAAAGRDVHLDRFFNAAPHRLAVKVAAVVRKLNYLSHGAPYAPALGRWRADDIREELGHAAEEAAALLGHLSLGTPLPPFRGEDHLVAEPGDGVEYVLYDWGEWETHRCVAVAATPPYLLLRFGDRHVEEVDTTISYVYTVAPGAVDLAEPLERRRTAFEVLLYTDDVVGEDDRAATFHLGLGRVLYTCPCCGYPSRRRRAPAFARLPVVAPATTPACELCGWADSPDDDRRDAETWNGAGNGGVPLAEARRNALDHGHMFGADADDELAGPYRSPGVQRVRALFNALAGEDDPRRRPELWEAALAALGHVAPGVLPEPKMSFNDTRERIHIAARSAAAAL